MPIISKTNPVNWGAAINSGLQDWWACLGQPWSMGFGLTNLTGRYPMVHADTTSNTGVSRGIYKNGSRFATVAGTENASSSARINGSALSSRFTIAVDLMGFVAAGTDAAGTNTITCYPINLGPTNETAAITWYHPNASYNAAFYMKGNGSYPGILYTRPAAYARAHIVATWNGTTMEVYVNGKSDGTNANSTYTSTDNVLRIGNFSNSYRSFPGVIYSVKTLNRVWSVSEVNRDYTESRLGYPTALNRVRNVCYFIQSNSFQAAWARGCNSILQPGVLN